MGDAGTDNSGGGGGGGNSGGTVWGGIGDDDDDDNDFDLDFDRILQLVEDEQDWEDPFFLTGQLEMDRRIDANLSALFEASQRSVASMSEPVPPRDRGHALVDPLPRSDPHLPDPAALRGVFQDAENS